MYNISKKFKLGLVTGLSALVLNGCSVLMEEHIFKHSYKGNPLTIFHKDIKFSLDEYTLTSDKFYIRARGTNIHTLIITTDDGKVISLDDYGLRIKDK